MSKINTITLSNFKFFGKEGPINIGGKNLLLYGENGSGKSSLFWGIYTLLEASFKQSVETDKYFQPFGTNEESLVNIYATKQTCPISLKEHCDSCIKIKADDDTEYVLSLLDSTICGNTNAQESRKATDFINYQSIFKFQDFKNSEKPNLYEVFNYSVLPYITFPSFPIKGKTLTNAGAMWEEYKKGPGTTTNYKGDTIQVYKNSLEYTNFQKFEKHFNEHFKKLMEFVNSHASDYVKKLGYNIEFELKYTSPSHIKKDKNYEWTPFGIDLIITNYNNQAVQIKKPQSFLNEAKMSAIAVAIRLAIIDQRIGEAVPDALKVLVLDDLMISLDMSNRNKLMDLLLNDFANRYQILFFTHDKMLFDFVDHKIKQHKQETNWLRKEMYVGEDDGTHKEFPVIINGESDPIEKARKYYTSRDYVVSGLFIRKAIEKLIVTLLPKELYLRPNGGFVELQTLWEKLKEFYSHNGNKISADTIHLFEDSKLLVLNPAAHFQRLATPVYRNELINAFSLYDELSKLPKIEKEFVISKGSIAEFNFPEKDYYCKCELDNNLVIIEGNNLISVMPMCKNIYWRYQGIDYFDFETRAQNLDHRLRTASPKLNKFLEGLTQKIPLGITEEQFMENCTINGTKLNDYLGGVKLSSLILASTKA